MSLNRTTPSSKNGEYKGTNAPEGENEARLAFVADLGLQRKEYKGEYLGDIQQIALGFEIIGQTVTIADEEQPRLLWTKPFYIYSVMGEKSNEFKYYKVFDPLAEPESVPDWDAQLGKPCNVVIKHVKGKGDKADRVYDNIVDVVAIPQKYQSSVGPMTLKPAIGNCEDTENEAIKKLFGLAKMVWERRITSVEGSAKGAEESGNSSDFDDDIPF